MRTGPASSRRYTTLILAVAMFLIFDLGVLSLNLLISDQIKEDATLVALTSRLRLQLQNNALMLAQIESRERAGESADFDRSELSKDVFGFDEALRALRDGGAVEATDGSSTTISAMSDPRSRQLLTQIAHQWTPFRDLAEKYLAEPSPLNFAPLLAFAGSERYLLTSAINDLTGVAEELSAARAMRLRNVQLLGIALATANFVLILLHFIRRLRLMDRAAEAARSETQEILATVNEGLFLLSRDGSIGAQYSRQTPVMLGDAAPAGQNFFALLAPRVDAKTLQAARDYVDLLFGDRVNEKLVATLNPLEQVGLAAQDGVSSSYLEFRFSRVREAGRTVHLLVAIQDITRRVLLADELARLRAASQQQSTLLFEVLAQEPEALAELLRNTRRRLNELNRELGNASVDEASLRARALESARVIHAIKGDAAACGLSSLAASAHRAEDALAGLKDRARLGGEDFVAFAQGIAQVLAQVDLIETALARLSAFARKGGKAPDAIVQARQLAQQIARETGKALELADQGWDRSVIDEAHLEAVHSVLNQLVRNAAVHGIESIEERRAQGKPDQGRIEIRLDRTEGGAIVMVCRDDGRGIDPRRIAATAVARGRLTEAEVRGMSSRELVELIFDPDFSTQDVVGEHAGRGVGLDFVRSAVTRLGGRLKVSSRVGQGAEFRIQLPASV